MSEIVYAGSFITLLLTVYGAHKSRRNDFIQHHALLLVGIFAIMLAAMAATR